jgi:outer membrane protein
MKRVASPLALSLCLALSSSARAQAPADPGQAALRRLLVGQGGLTAAEVARRAVASSREVSARRATAEASRAREDQATAGFWPKLSGSARYTRSSRLPPVVLSGGLVPARPEDRVPGPVAPNTPLLLTPGFPFPTFENNGALVGSLSLPVSDYVFRLSRAVTAAERSTNAALKDEEASRRQVAADARISYYDWIRARAAVLVLEDRLRAVEEQVKDVRHMFEAGFSSKADVLRGESQRSALSLQLTRGRNAAALAEEALRVAMHDDSREPYQVGEDLLQSAVAVPGLDDPAASYKEALTRRPELSVLTENERATRDLEALAKIARYPRVDLQGNVQYANPNQRVFPPHQAWDLTWDASVVLTWTPSDILSANANAREQGARATEISARKGQLLDGIRLELSQASSAVREADTAVAVTKETLASAEEGYRVRRELFRAGKSTMVEVIDAEAELTRARLDVVNAQVEARIARVRFDHAVGRDG